MKSVLLTILMVGSAMSCCIASPASDVAEVAPLLAAMGAAANAHDVDRHVGFYAKDPTVILISDGEEIVGWDAIRDKQREWWNNGHTDVAFTPKAKPELRSVGKGLVVATLLLTARVTGAAGKVIEGSFAVSALWQKRPEGWRVIYSHESSTR